MSLHPPRLPQKLFSFVAGNARVDDLLGDIDELFYLNAKKKSVAYARRQYWRHVISLCFSYALRKRKRDATTGPYSRSDFSFDMLKSYMTIAMRNLHRYKGFTALNVFGLAIGMSISLLLISIYSYVSTYDNFHKNKEGIYTVVSQRSEGVEEHGYSTAPIALADKISSDLPGVEHVVRLIRDRDVEIRTPRESIPVDAYFVQPEFFSVFSFEMVSGSAAALGKPGMVILTASAAMKFFNTKDVIGKTIELNNGRIVEVAGVMKDPPNNTHLRFEMLFSYSSLPPRTDSPVAQWTNYDGEYIYLMLRHDVAPVMVTDFVRKVGQEMYEESPIQVDFALQHIDEIAMGPDLRQQVGRKWEASGFIVFGVFAALILLPACFNYVNISVARALRRAKEIGLRKTMGGQRNQIFSQFIAETLLVAAASLILSILIFVVIRSEFQSMMVEGSTLDLSITWRTALLFLSFAVTVGILTGVFPAMYFARLNPVQALKSKVTSRGASMRIRKALSVFQFVLSFGFILSLVVFSRQYRYVRNFDFGFEKENIINVELQDVGIDRFAAKFSQISAVKSISMASGPLGVGAPRTWIHVNNDSVEVSQLSVDSSYLRNFGLTLLAGTNFGEGTSGRERSVIVNEEFVNALKLHTSAEALGQVIEVDGKQVEIIGVVKNFHYEPLRFPIGKFMFRNDPSQYAVANLHVVPSDAFGLFTTLEKAWKDLGSEKKFVGRYVEDELQEAYQSYTVLLKIVGFLGILAITISLLGMLGMIIHTTETRTKEVSVRKVLGASVQNIVLTLSREYLVLMSIGILISLPVTVVLLDHLIAHLQHYNAPFSLWDFIVSVVFLLALGLLTIFSQTYKTATSNPAPHLRSE
jgi:putative ABC transport system permease protein